MPIVCNDTSLLTRSYTHNRSHPFFRSPITLHSLDLLNDINTHLQSHHPVGRSPPPLHQDLPLRDQLPSCRTVTSITFPAERAARDPRVVPSLVRLCVLDEVKSRTTMMCSLYSLSYYSDCLKYVSISHTHTTYIALKSKMQARQEVDGEATGAKQAQGMMGTT